MALILDLEISGCDAATDSVKSFNPMRALSSAAVVVVAPVVVEEKWREPNVVEVFSENDDMAPL